MLTVLHVEQIKQFVLAGRRPTVVSPCLFSHAQSLFPPDVCVRYVFLSSWTVPVQGFRLLGLERGPQGPGEGPSGALRGPPLSLPDQRDAALTRTNAVVMCSPTPVGFFPTACGTPLPALHCVLAVTFDWRVPPRSAATPPGFTGRFGSGRSFGY